MPDDQQKMNNISCSSMQQLKIKNCKSEKSEKCSNEELMTAAPYSDSDSGNKETAHPELKSYSRTCKFRCLL